MIAALLVGWVPAAQPAQPARIAEPGDSAAPAPGMWSLSDLQAAPWPADEPVDAVVLGRTPNASLQCVRVRGEVPAVRRRGPDSGFRRMDAWGEN